MQILYKILVLVLFVAAGFMLVPIMIHFTIWANILNSEIVPQDFLEKLVQKSSLVWMGAIVIGITSLFIEQRWRLVFLLCPLLLPAFFALIYIVMQG